MPDSRLDTLLARLVEETISSEELMELETLLDGNREAQQRYLCYLDLHSHLGEIPGIRAKRSADPGMSHGMAMPNWAFAAVAAVFVAMLSMAVFLWATNREKTIARLADLNGPVAWMPDGSDGYQHLDEDDIGVPLLGGTLEAFAAGGWAKIEFRDGTSLEVSGHAALKMSDLENGKTIHLRKGELSMDVVPQPADEPMRITTPAADLIVLGTQFNVAANSFSTQLTVNEGEVRIKRLADGQVLNVPAEHFAVAALEHDAPFEAHRRKRFADTWKSELPRDAVLGTWREGAVRAHTHLWRGEPNYPEPPVLLHTVVLDASQGDLPPVMAHQDSRLRFRGRLERDHRVIFGFTTYHPRGGFSGKFSVPRKIVVDENGEFEVELNLQDYRRSKACFPVSPAGHEIHQFWILTVTEDAGLEIFSGELLR
ncbi:MAG: FecR family protein [Verrucomicrobiota bacterium]